MKKSLEADLAEPQMEEPKISPEEYGRILGGLQLLDLELRDCTMQSAAGSAQEEKRRVVVDDSGARFETGPDNSVLVWHEYSLKAKIGRKTVFSLKATFKLTFLAEEAFTADFFQVFRELNLTVHTWPFFRELLTNLSERTSLPRLTLPLLKYKVDQLMR